MSGFIKLHRQLLDWEWYKDIPVRILFEHCLLKANYKAKKWQGIVIEVGSFVTSYENLSFETGLTVQQVRTALNKLKSTGEVTSTSTSRYSIITIKNWNDYQDINTQDNKQATNEQQTSNKQITTTKESKEREESKERKNIVFTKCVVEEKKLDPFFENSIIQEFQKYHLMNFNCKAFLSANQRQKLMELNSDITDFKETIPIALKKLKEVNFDFPNFTPTANWLLKEDNYTAILNGAYDKKKDKFDLYREELARNGQTWLYQRGI